MPVRRGETLAKCPRGDNWNMKARRRARNRFMLERTEKETRCTP